jgi:hypothetical protein
VVIGLQAAEPGLIRTPAKGVSAMTPPVCRWKPPLVLLPCLRAAPGPGALRSPHPIVRALALAGIAARGGRWLLPWACVLVLAGILGHAANHALGQTVVKQSALSRSSAEPLHRPLADASFRWVVLLSTDAQGAEGSLTCLVAADRVSAAVLQVRAEDLIAVASELCGPLPTDHLSASEGR